MASFVALILLAGLMATVVPFVPHANFSGAVWCFIYLIWAIFGAFVWHHPRAPSCPRRWLNVAILSLVAAPLWYGFALLAAKVFFRGDEPALSEGIDLIVTLIICPGLTFVAIAGAVREVVLQRSKA